MDKIGVALIGSGGISLANHLPGIRRCSQAQVVALCDNNPAVLEKASLQSGITATYSDYHEVLARPEVDAVIVATPNFTHAPIVLAAVAAGKHVMCEKPLALNFEESRQMYQAAEAAGVRHMTAFTYRFVPAMRYMVHLVHAGAIGQPYHFRVNRFQDWGNRNLGWRQVEKLAGSGELGDMLSHRIDYAHILFGPMTRLVASTRRFLDERGGQVSDLEDWVAIISEFKNGATGLFESSKLASGRGEGGQSQDYCEVNGSAGSLVYNLNRPHELLSGQAGGAGLETIAVPDEFLKLPGAPGDPHQGDPVVNFRFEQDYEFIDAILNNRPCYSSFLDGVRAQAVMDAALQSARENSWVDVVWPE